MKTKIVLAAFALSLSIASFAQEKTDLEKRITNYSIKIDSIVSSEKKKMNLELDYVESEFKDGKISETTLKEEKNRISTAFSEVINNKIDAEKDELDAITKASAINTVMGKEDDRLLSIRTKRKEKTPKEKLKSGGLVISTGILSTESDGGSFNFFNGSQDFKGSLSTSITSVRERQIGKYTSPLFINYGYGIRVDTYQLKGNQVLSQANDQLNVSPFANGDLKYSILRESYLEIPVNLSYVLNRKYIYQEGEKVLDADANQWRVGVSLYGGVRIGNRIRYKYSNAESDKNIFIQKVENGVNPFIFGTKLSIGYAGFNLFVKKDFSPIFNSDANIAEKHALQIGIELATFNF
ncbi:hypothetical protein [Frigoriflavimonas asaccharolytica]|uniref:Outer membrane protein with beta-barrel domain n=1 Tax=Frigoriflavimonas asaccharolytica TaxID=2735899 RepID=A0A8J8G9D5_9FLAO|nr:hypothetical protein [Frigoriflavimonas asaccharolytica]NRS91919.1 hypothetical protein [Frigoriflavimonas asaccharolytica]